VHKQLERMWRREVQALCGSIVVKKVSEWNAMDRLVVVMFPSMDGIGGEERKPFRWEYLYLGNTIPLTLENNN